MDFEAWISPLFGRIDVENISRVPFLQAFTGLEKRDFWWRIRFSAIRETSRRSYWSRLESSTDWGFWVIFPFRWSGIAATMVFRNHFGSPECGAVTPVHTWEISLCASFPVV